MTDEEMADKYVIDTGNNDCTIDAFLARLKAGGLKWHKVADGDLPDNTDNVLSDKGVIVYYNFTHACWVDERASVEIDDVVAWCEIPQYKK